MRRLIYLLLAFAVGVIGFAFLSGARVTAATPVSVLSADRVVLLLPVSPSVERVVTDLRTELIGLSETTRDPRIARALQRAGADDELLHRVAASPVEKFDSGQAVATATPLLDIDLSPERP